MAPGGYNHAAPGVRANGALSARASIRALRSTARTGLEPRRTSHRIRLRMISPDLLELLVCPENRTPLALADAGLVTRLNAAIGQRQLKNRGGQVLEMPLD